MTVKEFVNKYKNIEIKDVVIQDKYVSYDEKVARCQLIIHKTMFNDNKYFANTAAKKMMFALTMVDLYTNIDIDFSNCIEEYDLLESNNLFDLLFSYIPEEEFSRMTVILLDYENDVKERETSLINFLEAKKELLDNVLNTLFEIVTESQEENVETES